MKSFLPFSIAVGCTILATGCCKSMGKDKAINVQPAETVVALESSPRTVDPVPPVEMDGGTGQTESAEQGKTEPLTHEEEEGSSAFSWFAFSAVVLLIGWLAHKFIFRKR
jgi:hypothetical protein